MNLPILDQKLGDVREYNSDYRLFEEVVLDRTTIERLNKITPLRIRGATVRHNINDIILGHLKKPHICSAIHESRDSLIDIRRCPNTSHACFHGETTVIPGMLVGAFLISQITGNLPFQHPGILFREMIHQDRIAQRLYGVGDEDERFLTSLENEDTYRERCKKIRPEIEKFQATLYENRIRPYVETFIKHIQEAMGKN